MRWKEHTFPENGMRRVVPYGVLKPCFTEDLLCILLLTCSQHCVTIYIQQLKLCFSLFAGGSAAAESTELSRQDLVTLLASYTQVFQLFARGQRNPPG